MMVNQKCSIRFILSQKCFRLGSLDGTSILQLRVKGLINDLEHCRRQIEEHGVRNCAELVTNLQ